jgi:hypothetical protein
LDESEEVSPSYGNLGRFRDDSGDTLDVTLYPGDPEIIFTIGGAYRGHDAALTKAQAMELAARIITALAE